jgi:hypothetical protein
MASEITVSMPISEYEAMMNENKKLLKLLDEQGKVAVYQDHKSAFSGRLFIDVQSKDEVISILSNQLRYAEQVIDKWEEMRTDYIPKKSKFMERVDEAMKRQANGNKPT